MKFGLSIPSFGSLATPENIKEISATKVREQMRKDGKL